jgi:bacterioferritin
MAHNKKKEGAISRDHLADLLNEDLAREYQAIIAYVIYSQVLKGAEYMNIADQLEIHAKQELEHALIISRQIDYLGKMPVSTPKPVKTSDDPKEMLRADLTIASGCASAKNWANTRWPNKFGKSW